MPIGQINHSSLGFISVLSNVGLFERLRAPFINLDLVSYVALGNSEIQGPCQELLRFGSGTQSVGKKPTEENCASDQTCMIPGAHPPPPGQFPGLPPGQPITHQPHPTMQMMSPYLGQPMQGQALAGGAAPPVPVHAIVYDHTQVDGGPQV